LSSTSTAAPSCLNHHHDWSSIYTAIGSTPATSTT
jgi:hypothetical protein